MHPLQTLISTAEYIGHNFAHNLKFFSDDQLRFKPAPTSLCALEVTAAAAATLLNMKAALSDGEFGQVIVDAPSSRAEAQELIIRTSTEYADLLKELDTSGFGHMVNLGVVKMPKGQCVMIPIIDLIHHHGQIAYIQTLLGDTESHFHTTHMQGFTE